MVDWGLRTEDYSTPNNIYAQHRAVKRGKRAKLCARKYNKIIKTGTRCVYCKGIRRIAIRLAGQHRSRELGRVP